MSAIDDAADEIVGATFGQELPESPTDLARAVFESIDVDALGRHIARRTGWNTSLPFSLAEEVKAYLLDADS